MDHGNEKKARSTSGVNCQSRTVGRARPALRKKVHKFFAGSRGCSLLLCIIMRKSPLNCLVLHNHFQGPPVCTIHRSVSGEPITSNGIQKYPLCPQPLPQLFWISASCFVWS